MIHSPLRAETAFPDLSETASRSEEPRRRVERVPHAGSRLTDPRRPPSEEAELGILRFIELGRRIQAAASGTAAQDLGLTGETLNRRAGSLGDCWAARAA
jgi:hypothetical protein